MADWPLPPYSEPRGPVGDDRDVVRAYVRGDIAPHSGRLHVEGDVLLAERDAPIVLRIGSRTFLVRRDLYDELVAARDVALEVFTEEGLTLFDDDTLLGPAVGTQVVALRASTWDLWGADIDQAFYDLRLAAVGGDEDMLGGGGGPPPGT